MANAAPNLTPAEALAAMIARGVAAFESSLPDYARGPVEVEEPHPRITLDEDRQRELCLSCPRADCVGLASPRCPIRIEQRAEWRRNRRR